MASDFLSMKNGEASTLAAIPELSVAEFRTGQIARVCDGGRRVSAFFGMAASEGRLRILSVLSNPRDATLELSATVVDASYPSLTPDCPAFHWFERELAEQFGVIPTGHPWLKPIRFHRSWTSHDAWGRTAADPILPGVTEYFEMKGPAIQEVAVGPVHAGVIEPGHFRFQCMGEEVYLLEISLGYQHRGLERLLQTGPDKRSLHYVETAAGDTSIASAWNYAAILEALTDCHPSSDSLRLRGIALELERIANHVGDLGALAGDVAFLPGASFCGRIRGEYLNLTAELCGNRFGRGLIAPGGTNVALEPERAMRIVQNLERVWPELRHALDHLFDSPTVLDRLEGTGAVPRETAQRIGLVGVAARASGLRTDARHEFPHRDHAVPPPSVSFRKDGAGDVMARAMVRYDEIRASQAWLFRELRSITGGIAATPSAGMGKWSNPCPCAADSVAVALTEGWRGVLCHVAVTDSKGGFSRYKIVDPSFHNWFGLAMALRGEQISNFPICNKSFNLSYCGHDL